MKRKQYRDALRFVQWASILLLLLGAVLGILGRPIFAGASIGGSIMGSICGILFTVINPHQKENSKSN